MDIMEKIGKATSDTCKVTVMKTGKIAQRARLRMYINECKSQIEEEYMSIGKKVYEKHVREENIDISKDLKYECAKIDELTKKIDNTIEHILVLKNMKKCPNCYTEINIEYHFCPNCGKSQNINNKEKEQNEDICEENQEELGITEKENNE